MTDAPDTPPPPPPHDPGDLRADAARERLIARGPRNPVPLDPYAFEPRTFEELFKLCTLLARTGVVQVSERRSDDEDDGPRNVRRHAREEEVLAIIMAGRNLGLTVMQSVRGFDMIGGVPAMRVHLMHAIVLRSGTIEVLAELDTNGDGAAWRYKRVGWTEERIARFTKEQAIKAGLLNSRSLGWKKYPGDMYPLRALARALRGGWDDLLHGMVSVEELQDTIDVEATPAPTSTSAPDPIDARLALPAPAATFTVTPIPAASPIPDRIEAPPRVVTVPSPRASATAPVDDRAPPPGVVDAERWMPDPPDPAGDLARVSADVRHANPTDGSSIRVFLPQPEASSKPFDAATQPAKSSTPPPCSAGQRMRILEAQAELGLTREALVKVLPHGTTDSVTEALKRLTATEADAVLDRLRAMAVLHEARRGGER